MIYRYLFLYFVLMFSGNYVYSQNSIKVKINKNNLQICKNYDLDKIYQNTKKYILSGGNRDSLELSFINKIEFDTTTMLFYSDNYNLGGYAHAYGFDDYFLKSGIFIPFDSCLNFGCLYHVGFILLNDYYISKFKEILENKQDKIPVAVDSLIKRLKEIGRKVSSSYILVRYIMHIEPITFNLICNATHTLVKMKLVYLKDTVNMRNALVPFVMGCDEWNILNKELQKKFSLKMYTYPLNKPFDFMYYYDFKDMKSIIIIDILEMEILTNRGFIKIY